jgi:hypothetical protein
MRLQSVRGSGYFASWPKAKTPVVLGISAVEARPDVPSIDA